MRWLCTIWVIKLWLGTFGHACPFVKPPKGQAAVPGVPSLYHYLIFFNEKKKSFSWSKIVLLQRRTQKLWAKKITSLSSKSFSRACLLRAYQNDTSTARPAWERSSTWKLSFGDDDEEEKKLIFCFSFLSPTYRVSQAKTLISSATFYTFQAIDNPCSSPHLIEALPHIIQGSQTKARHCWLNVLGEKHFVSS